MIYRNPDSSYDKKPIYVIDGKFFYHKEGKFEEVFVDLGDGGIDFDYTNVNSYIEDELNDRWIEINAYVAGLPLLAEKVAELL